MKIISSIINPALNLWLRAQLDDSDRLTVAIDTPDGEILQGKLDQVSLKAERVIYQGLNLRRVRLIAKQIKFNLGQVMQGKSLELLAPINGNVNVTITQEDINNSIASSLLQRGVCDLLQQIFTGDHRSLNTANIECRSILFRPAQTLAIEGLLDGDKFELSFKVKLISINELLLNHFCWRTMATTDTIAARIPHQWRLNLGKSCQLNCLTIEAKTLMCEGKLIINPTMPQAPLPVSVKPKTIGT